MSEDFTVDELTQLSADLVESHTSALLSPERLPKDDWYASSRFVKQTCVTAHTAIVEMIAYKGQLAAERAKVTLLEAALGESRGKLSGMTDMYKAEFAIVQHIWHQLGNPSFEDLKGRSIHDLVDEKDAQLAAERAKVALAVDALTELKTPEMELGSWAIKCIGDNNSIIDDALTVIGSSDILADIRREVARECASIARAMLFAAPESKWESSCNDAFERVAKAIRARFGVTE